MADGRKTPIVWKNWIFDRMLHCKEGFWYS